MRFFGALWARRAIFRELACSALCALAPGFRDFLCVFGPGMGGLGFFYPALRHRDLGAIARGVGGVLGVGVPWGSWCVGGPCWPWAGFRRFWVSLGCGAVSWGVRPVGCRMNWAFHWSDSSWRCVVSWDLNLVGPGSGPVSLRVGLGSETSYRARFPIAPRGPLIRGSWRAGRLGRRMLIRKCPVFLFVRFLRFAGLRVPWFWRDPVPALLPVNGLGRLGASVARWQADPPSRPVHLQLSELG